MNILSLFNGIGCGPYVLKKMGIKIDKLYVSEIDKYANIVNDRNHPESIHLGCVKKIWEERFEPEMTKILSSIDLYIGGSPCSGFSSAGKLKNFDDPQSSLFFYFIDILDRVKELNFNVKFMLENVRMKKEWLNVISEFMGVAPEMIDSSLVSAQVRKRYYWANWGICQPEDRRVFLKDVVLDIADEKYLVPDAGIRRVLRSKYSMARIFPDKTGTLNVKNNSGQLSLDSGTTFIPVIIQRSRGANKGNLFTDKSPTLSANSWDRNNELLYLGKLRRITPIEFCRLQGLPDGYFFKDGSQIVSDSQIYKTVGLAWQCDTIEHIFKNLGNQ